MLSWRSAYFILLSSWIEWKTFQCNSLEYICTGSYLEARQRFILCSILTQVFAVTSKLQAGRDYLKHISVFGHHARSCQVHLSVCGKRAGICYEVELLWAKDLELWREREAIVLTKTWRGLLVIDIKIFVSDVFAFFSIRVVCGFFFFLCLNLLAIEENESTKRQAHEQIGSYCRMLEGSNS